MNETELKKRTQQFALEAMRLADALPRSVHGQVIGRQLIRSATSVGANYRAACKGRSRSEFVAKLGTVEEEADECAHWLELIIAGGLLSENAAANLLSEANQITAIIAASRKTAPDRNQPSIANRKSQIGNPS
jgi:four helix bundle protein